MRLYPKMGDNTKQVRVDNWGIFFLQRLQMFFSKTDYCDMTLQFEGNVQLKVHRLVMNACTEYFQFLEQTCALEDNVIMMPSDLQADVIVPIVNFMYTGMLEFHLSIFDRLYKTAQVMNITILTKLLDAQKQPVAQAVKPAKRKHIETAPLYTAPGKKPVQKPTHHHSDLPAPLPGRKLPVWKRKSIPTTSQTASPLCFSSEPATKWSQAVDPLSLPDNTPKPTRFEWPDEDLPPLNLMDTSFEEISYTSKPLLTQEEEHRASTSFDDLKHIPNANRGSSGASTSKKRNSPSLDMEEMKNYVKEQKIRSGLSHDSEESIVDEVEVESGSKRKPEKTKGGITKKVRFDEQENKTTTISISAEPKGTGGEINHEKIVTEILKKYPQLVKKNKNIRLKIMAKNKNGTEVTKVENVQVRAPRLKVQMPEPPKPEPPKPTIISKPSRTETAADEKTENKAPWICDRCSTEDEPVEFVLYYLYRKHMTDVHNEKFDSKLCKYCGHRCNKHNLLMYHLYTKHGMKPPPAYNFPKCDQCPFIALSTAILNKHKLRHGKNEIQCVECKLAFTSQATLTSHMQITGHTGKSNKNNYDCQYCTKRYQSGVNLFSHVRLQHRNEAIRDGIVSIDEIDDVEDFEEEENSKDEYILPEIITEPEPPKKVNILSNVKVQERHHEHHSRHQQLSLEPSSEAEALNNVATGIATSLGLVDIVVLNDNQQLFLQSNQQNFTSDQNEQPEFILPELTGRETFTTTNQNEVITTDGVITQSMLGTGDITSTDELVMVLTDHDYGDNQEEITSDNSNIVVLYSHPVDGQQDQFITTQGNIMVNSQTGLIEIRNGATITSTTTNHHQVVMTSQQEPSPIESIELIQREIESHTGQQQQQEEMKQETVLYEDDSKLDVREKEEGHPMKEQEVVTVNQSESDPLIESLVQGEQLEFVTAPESNDEPIAVEERVEDPPLTTPTQENEGKENEQTEEREEETVPCPPTNEEENEERSETHDDQVVTEHTTVEPMEVEDKIVEETSDETPSQAVEEETKTGEEENVAPPNEEVETETPENEDKREETVDNADPPQVEESEGDKNEEKTTEIPPPIQEEESKTEEEAPSKTEETPQTQNEENEETQPESTENSSKTDMMEIEETQEEITEEEKTVEDQITGGEQEMLSQSDTSTSQFNDENSQSSQESQQEEENEEKQKEELQQQESVSTKISILDDWEDTDSQQSDQKEKEKVAVAAGETVHKLMDDWEEEEEEEGRKEIDG